MNPAAKPLPVVLYVEDEEEDIALMRYAFKRQNLEPHLRIVPNGLEAKRYLAGQGEYADRALYPLPRVLLLDLKLPLVSGFELLAWVREQPNLGAFPIVAFSSSDREDERREAMELGAAEYLIKPAGGTFVGIVERLHQKWFAQAT